MTDGRTDNPGGGFGPRHLTPSIWSLTMTLPPNTYGVRCEFNPGGTLYTYLVDEPHQGEIRTGHHVVVASPKGDYKVILVVDNTDDLSPVDLKYMKYIVQKVDHDFYDILMRNLLAGDEKPQRSTSPLIDERDVNEPDDPRGQKVQEPSPNPRHGDDSGASG